MNNSASLAIAAIAASAARLCLADAPVFAAPFTAHAVLQRDCALPVWGTAQPGSAVTVALDDQRLSATADNQSGRWQVTFPAQREPGLGHTLRATGPDGESTTLEDIAIGDVWLCSGQSNMDMNYGWRLTRGREDIESADDPMMRLFDDHNAAALAPCDRLQHPSSWTRSDFAHSKTFSACGWFFGQALRKALPDIPIGLVEASWSGSPIKTWISREAYRGISPELAEEHDRSVAGAAKTASEFEAAGGKEGLAGRIALWETECRARGDIVAEGADYDDSAWKTVSLAAPFEKHIDKDFDGCVWYRRAIDLSAAQAAGEATLNLGIIDDEDVAWVNGAKVGSSASYDVLRSYKVPAGTLREGRNVIAVKVIDWRIGGGVISNPEKLTLALADGSAVPLAGEWRYEEFRFDPKPKDGSVNCWTPSACYNAMLHPLFPMALKGAIWYQGCSDVGGGGALYEKKFRAMAADWRAHFTHPDGMPIYLVQLAAFQQTHEAPFDSKWAEMRWAQTRLGETLVQSGTAVAIDVGDHADIHPKDKKTVGERLARLALARAYGLEGVVEAGPIPQAATLGGGTVSVTFRNASGLSTSDGGAVSGFQLVADDGRAVWAGATLSGETVSVAVPEGFAPVKVRFAWDDYPVCNLVNGEGLPCGPFELALH